MLHQLRPQRADSCPSLRTAAEIGPTLENAVLHRARLLFAELVPQVPSKRIRARVQVCVGDPNAVHLRPVVIQMKLVTLHSGDTTDDLQARLKPTVSLRLPTSNIEADEREVVLQQIDAVPVEKGPCRDFHRHAHTRHADAIDDSY